RPTAQPCRRRWRACRMTSKHAVRTCASRSRTGVRFVRTTCCSARPSSALWTRPTSQDGIRVSALNRWVFHATGAVLGLGAHDLEFAHGVVRLAPSADGIKDDFYGGGSHLSEVHVASRLSFNSIRLGLEKIFVSCSFPISFSISAIDVAPTF